MRRLPTRILALLLCAVCLLCPSADAAADGSDIIFLALNDAMPYGLSGGTMPFWSGGVLYVHSSTFDITSLNLSASYNASNMTLLLYNGSTRRSLTFYLSDGYVQTQNGTTEEVTASMRGDQVFLPLDYCAGFFGIGVSYLTSLQGWPLVRLTTGAQVWEDVMFIQKADKLINERADKYLGTAAPVDPPVEPPTPPLPPEKPDDPPPEEDVPPEEPPDDTPEKKPNAPVVYPALVGINAVTAALPVLEEHQLPAAVYLDADDILDNGDLVRRLYTGGYSIGLTGDIEQANDALNLVLCRRSLMVLDQDADGYLCHFATDEAVDTLTDAPALLRLDDSSADDILEQLLEQNAQFLLLRETTALFTD